MPFLATSTRGAFKAAFTAGAVALTVAGATLAGTAPAEAFVRHGGGFHGGFHRGSFHRFGGVGRAHFGGVHRFGYGHGRRIGAYGFRRGFVGVRTVGFRRFAYRVGYPFYGAGYRICPVGRHFVPGLGCRLNAVYGYRTFGYRPHAYGVRRIVRPVFGYGFRRYGYVHPFGDYNFGHGFRRAGFGGFRHAGIGHGGRFHRR